jgi:phage shock protein A
MVNEPVLRDCLIQLIEHCKEQAGITAKLIHEVTAMREAIGELDPRFDAVLAKKKTEHSTEQLQRITIQLFDDIIQRLERDRIQ